MYPAPENWLTGLTKNELSLKIVNFYSIESISFPDREKTGYWALTAAEYQFVWEFGEELPNDFTKRPSQWD